MALTSAQLDLLSQCFLFEALPPEALPPLTASLSAEHCPAGTVIYSQIGRASSTPAPAFARPWASSSRAAFRC